MSDVQVSLLRPPPVLDAGLQVGEQWFTRRLERPWLDLVIHAFPSLDASSSLAASIQVTFLVFNFQHSKPEREGGQD